MRTRIALTTTMTVIATSMVVSSFIAGAGTGPTHSPGPAVGWVTASDRVPSSAVVPDPLGIPEGGIQGAAGLAPRTSGTPRGGGAGRSLSAELSMANALHRVTPTLTPPPTSGTSSNAGTAAPDRGGVEHNHHEHDDHYDGPTHRCDQHGHRGLGLHPDPRIGRSLQQPGRAVWRVWRPAFDVDIDGHGGLAVPSPPSAQDAIALALYHRYGWTPWSTRFVCGLG